MDRTRFQNWLKAKYKTLANLNTRWTTAYWSETYQSWDQILIQSTYGNPGLLLNWREFVTDTWRSYQKNQLDVIRPNTVALPVSMIVMLAAVTKAVGPMTRLPVAEGPKISTPRRFPEMTLRSPGFNPPTVLRAEEMAIPSWKLGSALAPVRSVPM